MLEQEAMEAWDERKRKARVLGEAAATKLLVPMILMMAVVMAIIMIPAFLSFYGLLTNSKIVTARKLDNYGKAKIDTGGENMNAVIENIQEFIEEEDAVGVVEIILILVVLISLVIIFKKQLTDLVNSIISKITKQSNSI